MAQDVPQMKMLLCIISTQGPGRLCRGEGTWRGVDAVEEHVRLALVPQLDVLAQAYVVAHTRSYSWYTAAQKHHSRAG